MNHLKRRTHKMKVQKFTLQVEHPFEDEEDRLTTNEQKREMIEELAHDGNFTITAETIEEDLDLEEIIAEAAESYLADTESYADDEVNLVTAVMRNPDTAQIEHLLIDFGFYYEGFRP